MKRALFIALLVLLAGCSKPASEVSEGPDSEGTDDVPMDDDASAGAPPKDDEDDVGEPPEQDPKDPSQPIENAPPSAILVAAPIEGTAPLEVAFTLDGADPEGGNVTWTFDADGDGTAEETGESLPANVTFTYGEGDFVANLTVSDGGLTAFAHANITAIAAEVEPAGQSVSASYVIAAEGCVAPAHELSATDLLGPAGGTLNGVTRVQFDIEAATIGMPYTAEFTFDVGFLYVAVAFLDDGEHVLQSQNSGTNANMANYSDSGTVPANAAVAVMYACAGPTEASVVYQAGI